MNTVLATILLAALAPAPAPAAPKGHAYRVAGRFLERDGKAAFLVGANYIPPRDWLANLRTWDAPAVEADMAALERLGVRTIRWFPLWPLTQPDPDTIDETVLRRVDEVVRLAGRHHIDVQISPLTGWMSGYFVLPPWARGATCSSTRRRWRPRQRLVGQIATRYRGNPAVQGFDFGNELNVVVEFVRTKATVPGMEAWMDAIYRAFKSGSPEHLVTNGIGTGFTKEFNVDAIARTSDYVSVHSYPGVHRTSRMDPVPRPAHHLQRQLHDRVGGDHREAGADAGDRGQQHRGDRRRHEPDPLRHAREQLGGGRGRLLLVVQRTTTPPPTGSPRTSSGRNRRSSRT